MSSTYNTDLSDAVAWGTENAVYQQVKSHITRLSNSIPVELDAYKYITDERQGNRRRLIIDDGYEYFGVTQVRMNHIGFLVSELSFSDLPPTFWRVVTWHVTKHWLIIEQVTRYTAPMPPMNRVYHLVIQ